MVIAHGKKNCTLYVTFGLETITVIAKVDEKLKIWHQRLGHMNKKGMKVLVLNKKLLDLKSVDVNQCEDYIFGKQKNGQFLTD